MVLGLKINSIRGPIKRKKLGFNTSNLNKSRLTVLQNNRALARALNYMRQENRELQTQLQQWKEGELRKGTVNTTYLMHQVCSMQNGLLASIQTLAGAVNQLEEVRKQFEVTKQVLSNKDSPSVSVIYTPSPSHMATPKQKVCPMVGGIAIHKPKITLQRLRVGQRIVPAAALEEPIAEVSIEIAPPTPSPPTVNQLVESQELANQSAESSTYSEGALTPTIALSDIGALLHGATSIHVNQLKDTQPTTQQSTDANNEEVMSLDEVVESSTDEDSADNNANESVSEFWARVQSEDPREGPSWLEDMSPRGKRRYTRKNTRNTKRKTLAPGETKKQKQMLNDDSDNDTLVVSNNHVNQEQDNTQPESSATLDVSTPQSVSEGMLSSPLVSSTPISINRSQDNQSSPTFQSEDSSPLSNLSRETHSMPSNCSVSPDNTWAVRPRRTAATSAVSYKEPSRVLKMRQNTGKTEQKRQRKK